MRDWSFGQFFIVIKENCMILFRFSAEKVSSSRVVEQKQSMCYPAQRQVVVLFPVLILQVGSLPVILLEIHGFFFQTLNSTERLISVIGMYRIGKKCFSCALIG